MTLCDLINGPCACGSWHKDGEGFGQPGMWPNGLPNGGDPTPPIDAKVTKLVTPMFEDPDQTIELPRLERLLREPTILEPSISEQVAMGRHFSGGETEIP